MMRAFSRFWNRIKTGVSVRFLGQAGVYGLGRALSQMTSVVLLPIYLSYLTPADYGVLAIAQMVGPVLTAFWTLGIEPAIGRYYYEYADREREQIVGTAFTLVRGTTVGGLVLTLIVGPWFFPHVVMNAPYSPHIQLVIWTAFFQSFSVLPLILMRVREEAHKYALATFGTLVVTAVANIYFLVVVKWGVVGVLVGNLVGSVISAVAYLWYLRGYMVLKMNWAYARRSIRYVLPMMPELTVGSLVQTADRFLLDKYVPVSVIGLFSLARQFASVAQQVIQSLKTAYTPLGFKIWTQKGGSRRRELSRISLWFVVVSSVTTAGVVLLSREFLLVLGQPRYIGAVPMIPLATVSGAVLVVYFVLSMTFLVSDNTRPLFMVFTGYAVSLVLLNALLIPWIGVWGALSAALLAQLVRAVVAYFLGERHVPIGLPLREIMVILLPLALIAPLGMWNWGGLVWPVRLTGEMLLLSGYVGVALVYMVRYRGIGVRQVVEKEAAGFDACLGRSAFFKESNNVQV